MLCCDKVVETGSHGVHVAHDTAFLSADDQIVGADAVVTAVIEDDLY